MVQSTIKTRVAIINFDGMCRCSNCMASLGMAIMNLELSEDPESDDLIHPDDLMPYVQRLFAQQVGHG